MRDHVHDLDGLAIGMAANGFGRETVSAAAREIERLRRIENERDDLLALIESYRKWARECPIKEK